MSEPPDVGPSSDTALTQLRAEISLLRRGVEALTAERQAGPDYTPTLSAMAERLDKMVEWMRKVAGTPLLQFTPERLQEEVSRVAANTRAVEREAAERARGDLQKATCDLSKLTESALKADEQLRALVATALTFLLAGMFLTLSLIEIDRPSGGTACAPSVRAIPHSRPNNRQAAPEHAARRGA